MTGSLSRAPESSTVFYMPISLRLFSRHSWITRTSSTLPLRHGVQWLVHMSHSPSPMGCLRNRGFPYFEHQDRRRSPLPNSSRLGTPASKRMKGAFRRSYMLPEMGALLMSDERRRNLSHGTGQAATVDGMSRTLLEIAAGLGKIAKPLGAFPMRNITNLTFKKFREYRRQHFLILTALDFRASSR